MPGDRPHSLQIAARLAVPLGLLLLVAAFVVWTITEPEKAFRSLPVMVPGVAGAVLFVLGALFSAGWLASIFFRRRALVGLNVVFMIFLFLVVVVVLNVISIRRYKRWDWTEQGLFTLSSETLNNLKGLDARNRTLQVTTLLGSSADSVRIKDLVEEYARHSSRFKVRDIDVYRNKAEVDLFIRSLKDKVSTEGVVFQYGDAEKDPDNYREKFIDAQDFLEYPPTNYMMLMRGQQPDPRFKGEETLTSAIIEIADPKKLKVYFTRGHSELDTASFQDEGLGELAKILKREHYEVAPLDILQAGEVPDDCSVLVIAGPEKPFEEKEVQAIREYLRRDPPRAGKLLLMVKPLAAGGDLSGLRDLLQEYNVRVRDNLLVVQEAVDLFTGRRVPQLTVYVSDWGQHPISKDLQTQRGVFALVSPVQAEAPSPPGAPPRGPQDRPWEVTPLATCGRATWGETSRPRGGRISLTYEANEEERGPFTMSVAVQARPPQPGMPPVPSPGDKARLVVIGDSTTAGNVNFAGAREANQGLILGSVNWLAEREYSVGIPPKTLQRHPLMISSKGRKAIRAISWFGLPGLVIVAGALVLWWRWR